MITVKNFCGLYLIGYLKRIIGGWQGRNRQISSVALADTPPFVGQICFVDQIGTAFACLRRPAAEMPAIVLLSETAGPPDEALWRLADAGEVPLLLVDRELSPAQVVLYLRDMMDLPQTDNFTVMTEMSLRRHRFLEEQDMPKVLQVVADFLATPLLLTDPWFNVLEDGGMVTEAIVAVLRQAAKQYACQNIVELQQFKYAGQNVYLMPLCQNRQNFGWLVLTDKTDDITAIDRYYLSETAFFCIQSICRKKTIEKIHRGYRENFLYDLLYNNLQSEFDIIRLGKLWKMNFNRAHLLLVVKCNSHSASVQELEVLLKIMEEGQHYFQSAFYPVISSLIMEQVVFLFECKNCQNGPAEIAELAPKLKEYLEKKLLGCIISIGIGKYYDNVSSLYKSYQEAKQALVLANFPKNTGGISFFTKLSLVRLLAHIGFDELEEYFQEQLNGLLAYDSSHATNYFELLIVYFDKNMDLEETAKQMYVHSNTLRNRIKKIEGILKVDLRDIQQCMELSLACKIYKMLHEK